jgi:hypothetical protein
MNNLRLGYIETTLLFYYYLNKNNISNEIILNSQQNFINWLLTTSGFYDKKIKGSNFNDFNFIQIKNNSFIYREYFDKLLFLLKKNNFYFQPCFHKIDSSLDEYKNEFLKFINYNNKHPEPELFTFMENKHILIINNLGSLMKQQFESGNLKKIHPKFPENLKSLNYFENGYTFFNNGPHNNILETCNHICEQIKDLSFDGAIISAGAYSCLIADFIINNLNKEAFVIGGCLSYYFGINTERTKIYHKKQINEFFINVPQNMKPEGYEKIEDGCYW